MCTKAPTVEEITLELIKALKEDPAIVRNSVPVFGEDPMIEYHTILSPAMLNPCKWLFVSAKRPMKRPETLPSGAVCHSGGFGFGSGGTDMAIFTFENEEWEDADHELIGIITYEFGAVIDITFKVSW